MFSRVTSIQRIHTRGWVAARSEYRRCLGEREGSPERVCGGLFLLRAGVEVREENVGLLRSPIFIPILFGDVVLGHFVSDDFAFVGIGGVFHALHDLCLERVSLLEQFVHAF